jgi:CzcA family heavy metal efflux pump
MKNFLKFLIKNKIAVVIGILLIIFLGGYSVKQMPVDLFPEMKIPVVSIITHYSGVSPKDMEILISKPIENKMMTIQGVKRVASTSYQDISLVTVEFKWGTPVFRAKQLVMSKLAEVKPLLPEGITPVIDSVGTRMQNVYGFVIYGSVKLSQLYNITKYQLSGKLLGVDGVSSIQILGGEKEAYFISINPAKLQQFEISLSEIKNAIKKYNISMVGGFINKSSKEYLIRGDAKLKSIDDIKNIPVKNIFLGDIADVYKGYAPKHYVVNGNNKPAVAVIVRKQTGASSVKVAKNIEKKLQKLKILFPSETKIKKFYDQSEIIKESRAEIINDLAVGSILVILILLLFIGDLKPTIIVSLTIPITFLGTLFFMNICGLGLNVITMTALVLAIGMIVDDAIVVTENIYRHSLNEHDSEKASINGAIEIAGPDASGTFTTVAAFLPLVIVGGIASVFFRPFGFTISVALLVSLKLSLTLVPVLFAKGRIAKINKDYIGIKIIKFLNKIIHSSLDFSFKHKFPVILFSLILFGSSILPILFCKSSVLPPIDEGAILIEYIMPPGTSLKESNRIGKILDITALSDPDVETVCRRTGSPEAGFQIEGVNRGEIMIKLKPKNVRKRSVDEIISSLRKAYSKFNGIVFLYHQPTQEKIDESFSGLPALFGVTIYGDDADKLIDISKKVENIMAHVEGINNIINNTKIKLPQIDIKLNYPELALHHIMPKDVFATLKAAKLGLISTEIIKNNKNIPLYLKLKFPKKPNFNQLKNLPITSNGNTVPLSKIADIHISYIPMSISHINGEREITLIADIEGNIPQIVKELQKKLKNINLPEGYTISFSGQYKVMIDTGVEIALASILAIILIYLIMAMQFRSLKQPLIILVTIPFSVAGALIFLFLFGQGLNISVGMGIVTLIGIAVNNAIVLVDYSNRMIRKGMVAKDAIFEAVSIRLRPIILTSVTTIAALIPTAIGTTVGSHIFQPFAISVIGGLITGMFGTLIIVPVLINKVKDRSKILLSN